MISRKYTLPALTVSVVGAVVGYVLTNSIKFGICSYAEVRDPVCLNFYERIGDPLFFGFGALALVFLFLLAVPTAFNAWKKFAIWFVPLATLLFIFYPEPGGMDFISPSPEEVFQWVSGLYVIVSVLIIGWVMMKQRQRK